MLKTRLGFTLIELLITITIIGILSGIGLTTFTASQKRGRDARRLSDLNQYRIALENYASVNSGVYPVGPANNGGAAAGTGIFNTTTSVLLPYLSGFPKDPKDGDYYYFGGGAGLNYVLSGCMEATPTLAWEFCFNGKSGQSTVTCAEAQADQVCDIP